RKRRRDLLRSRGTGPREGAGARSPVRRRRAPLGLRPLLAPRLRRRSPGGPTGRRPQPHRRPRPGRSRRRLSRGRKVRGGPRDVRDDGAAPGRSLLLQPALELYKRALGVIPLPDYAAALGDVYARIGRSDEARRQYDLVEYIGRLNAINKVIYNRELAYFYADHDMKLEQALDLAKKELE